EVGGVLQPHGAGAEGGGGQEQGGPVGELRGRKVGLHLVAGGHVHPAVLAGHRAAQAEREAEAGEGNVDRGGRRADRHVNLRDAEDVVTPGADLVGDRVHHVGGEPPPVDLHLGVVGVGSRGGVVHPAPDNRGAG